MWYDMLGPEEQKVEGSMNNWGFHRRRTGAKRLRQKVKSSSVLWRGIKIHGRERGKCKWVLFFRDLNFFLIRVSFLLHCAKEREWRGETKENKSGRTKKMQIKSPKVFWLLINAGHAINYTRNSKLHLPILSAIVDSYCNDVTKISKRLFLCESKSRHRRSPFPHVRTGRHLLLDLPELPAFRARDERVRVPGLRRREVAERKQDGVLRPPAQGKEKFHFDPIVSRGALRNHSPRPQLRLLEGSPCHSLTLGGVWGWIWAPNWPKVGRAAPGFEPRTSCMRESGVLAITIRGPPLICVTLKFLSVAEPSGLWKVRVVVGGD